MYMKNWLNTLDMFLKASNSELLNHAGSISHEKALNKAIDEYEKYRQIHLNDTTQIEKDFEEIIQRIKILK